MVIVRIYLAKKAREAVMGRGAGPEPGRTGGLWRFVGISLLYAVVFQVVVGQPQPLETFGFGVFEFNSVYKAIPELGVGRFTSREMYALFATAMVDAVAMVHYYFDSFIWKVSDQRVREGLQ
ncbi:MAG: hypothetical protein CM1200mP2_54750 [Planctomycetaceae bacterium]|nr:MAG: hypothetical protein CM1200mP2_54750 [Planctomycetaceae bacterium]